MTEAGTAGATAAPPERSWWPFAGAIGLAVVVVAVLVGGYNVVLYKLRRSDSGRAAVAEVRASVQLQRVLGEPLKIVIEGGELAHEGQASFEMRVRGTQARAQVRVESKRENKVWHVVRGTYALGEGPEQPLELAPAVAPPAPTSPEAPPARGPQP